MGDTAYLNAVCRRCLRPPTYLPEVGTYLSSSRKARIFLPLQLNRVCNVGQPPTQSQQERKLTCNVRKLALGQSVSGGFQWPDESSPSFFGLPAVQVF